jgi:hypothetical protein
MKYVVEYEYEPMDAEDLNNYCEENQCELVTIVKKDVGRTYVHYFRLI